MSNANQTENRNFAQHQNGKEQIDASDASTNAFPGSFQAIATAYGDYTKKSFEDTKSFVEKLSSVRSFDKAVEVQTDRHQWRGSSHCDEGACLLHLVADISTSESGFLRSTSPTTDPSAALANASASNEFQNW